MDVEIFKSAKKYLRIKKYPDTYNPSILKIESAVYVRKEKQLKNNSDLTPFAQFITSNVRIQNHIVN